MMPLLIGGMPRRGGAGRAEELLAARRAGRPDDPPARGSSRAGSSSAWRWRGRWCTDPLLLLADEPSGNLDHHNSERLHELFAALARNFETALVVVTHNRRSRRAPTGCSPSRRGGWWRTRRWEAMP